MISAVKAYVNKRFQNEWSETGVVYENVPDANNVEQDEKFIKVFVQVGNTDLLTLGSKKRERMIGVVIVQVFTKVESSTVPNDKICDKIRSLFRHLDDKLCDNENEFESGNILFRQSSPKHVGTEGELYQQNVVVPFEATAVYVDSRLTT